MASSGERRLLFDTRGKRKHVIQVVYAILALVMGASLFLVLSPINLATLIGSSSTTSSATKVFEEQVERIEGRLARNPDDEKMLLALTRARINAGNSLIEPATSETKLPVVPPLAEEEFEAASQAWSRYLKQAGDEPSATGAQLVASTYLTLAESGSFSYRESEANLEKAATAQRIAAEQRPSLGTLSSLAIFEYFSGDFAAADKTTKQVAAKAGTEREAKSIEEELAEYRKRAKGFQKNVAREAKQEPKAGQQALQNPFGGLGAAPAPGG